MHKTSDYGCMGYILLYAFVIVAPVLIVFLFDLNEDILPAYVVCLFIGFFVGGFLGLALFSDVKPDTFARLLCVFTIFVVTMISLTLYVALFDVDLYDDRTSASTSPSSVANERSTSTPKRNDNGVSIAAYYQRYYPVSWAYLFKYADNPYDYVVYYDDVWGDLQKYHGDGISFATLTPYEQSLVNYPTIGSNIYFARGGTTYHSTYLCYTLLRSQVSVRPARYSYMYEPCSKCVGE